jgi:hypothetical protein
VPDVRTSVDGTEKDGRSAIRGNLFWTFFVTPPTIVILRACDFFDLLVFFGPPGVFQSPPERRHPERSASQIYSVTQLNGAESKDPDVLISPMLLVPFQPPKPFHAL